MSRITATPVASPVDTFAAPEVRMPQTNASEILQVVGALQELNPQLATYGKYRQTALNNEAAVSASKLQAERMYKNMADLKAASERGDIEQADNPYFMLHMKQLVAHEEARTLQDQLSGAAVQQGLADKDTSQFASWLDDQLKGRTDNLDNWSGGFLARELTQVRESLLNEHNDRLKQRREADTLDLTGINIRRSLADIEQAHETGNVQALQDSKEKLQQFINSASASGVKNAALREIIVAQALSHAEAIGSTENVDTILRGIKIGDTTAADGLQPDALKDLDRRIAAQREADFELNLRKEERQRKEQTRAVLGEYFAARDQAIAAGKPPPSPESMYKRLGELPPDERLHIEDVMTVLSNRHGADAAKQIMGEAAEVIASGSWNKDAEVSYLYRLVAAGQSADDAAGSLKRLHTALNGSDDTQPIDFKAYNDIISQITSGTTPNEVTSAVTSLVEEKRLPRSVGLELINRAHAQTLASRPVADNAYRREMGLLNAHLGAALRGMPEMSEEELGTGRFNFTPLGTVTMENAQAEFNRSWFEWLDAHPQATTSEMNQYASGLRDNIMQTYARTSSAKLQEQATQVQVSRVMSAIASTGDPAKIGQEFAWKDGSFIKKSTGEVLTGPVNFVGPETSARTFLQKAPAIASSMGIKSSDDYAAFLLGQKDHLPEAERPAIVKQIRQLKEGSAHAKFEEARSRMGDWVTRETNVLMDRVKEYQELNKKFNLDATYGPMADYMIEKPRGRVTFTDAKEYIPLGGTLVRWANGLEAARELHQRLMKSDPEALKEYESNADYHASTYYYFYK